MSSRLESLLTKWLPLKEEYEWALCTIIDVEGSSYRKPGAMIMVNSLGQIFGLLSGGCLEGNLLRYVRQAWQADKSLIQVFDFSHDDNDWESSLGCGGIIKVLIQPIKASNYFLNLPELLQGLLARVPVNYRLHLNAENTGNTIISSALQKQTNPHYIDFTFTPTPLLVICGGGIDAIPLAKMAKLLEWRVYVCDPRSTFAKETDFAGIDNIFRQDFVQLSDKRLTNIDAAVCMTHNIALDAKALLWSQRIEAKYIGLLGPRHRTKRVFEYAKTHSDINLEALMNRLHNPVGMDIGGDTPESIALSILSEVHGVLEGRI